VESLAVEGPSGIAVGPAGALAVAQPGRNQVVGIEPGGTVRVWAGTGKAGWAGDGGPALAAELDNPTGLAFGPDGTLYIADGFNGRVRAVGPDGLMRTVAGAGPGAPLDLPRGVAVHGEWLYIADTGHHRVLRQRIDRPPAAGRSGEVPPEVVAGDGTPGYAGDGGRSAGSWLSGPRALALDAAGNLFIADSGNHRVRRVDPTGTISTVAGVGYGGRPVGEGGPATATDIGSPTGLAVGPDDRPLIVGADHAGPLVLRPDGTLAPLEGAPSAVGLAGPRQIAVAANGTVHVSEAAVNRIVVYRPVRNTGLT
jgi:serine/threonine-protein kinase